MLESSRFADEVSALVFCSMMSQYDIVLLGCLLPGSAAIGDWSLGLGGRGCWNSSWGRLLCVGWLIAAEEEVVGLSRLAGSDAD